MELDYRILRRKRILSSNLLHPQFPKRREGLRKLKITYLSEVLKYATRYIGRVPLFTDTLPIPVTKATNK